MTSQSSHPKKDLTLVIIKPDGIQRSLIGEIIKRIERVGLKIIALKMILATEEQLWKHYNKEDEWFLRKGGLIMENRKKFGMSIEKEAIDYGKDIIRSIIKFMMAGPMVAMVIEGNSSVAIVKKLVGVTDPDNSDVGTIRGDFTVDSYNLSDFDNSRAIRNLMHCTEGDQNEAKREIDIWFSPEELIKYRLVQEEILYDVDLDGILE